MGLAGVKVKQRFGLDPRNTSWSNNTERFGHQYLEKMGWAPGKGLGLVDHATTSHVKVSIKTDNAGLGSKLAKKTKKDEFDSGECAGLDVFQRILGRLNGKEEQINSELDRKRIDTIINGKWGMHFVKGETLRSTWDSDSKKLLNASKKRLLPETEEPAEKKAKKSKTSSLKPDKTEKKDKKDKKDKKEKKEKKDKKEKKEKKEKSKDAEKEKKLKKDKKDKKDKKEKKLKKLKSESKLSGDDLSAEVTRDSMLQPREAKEQQIATRLSARAKWIRQKRASVMDAKALNEIFMITK